MSTHRHPCLNDMPKLAAALQLKKTGGAVRTPPETRQVRDFPYRESHANNDTRCVKTRSEPRLSTVRLRDFSAGVCQPQTPSSIHQGLPLTHDRARRAHHARSWLCHISVTAFHTWKVRRNFDALARQKISRRHKCSDSREDVRFQGNKPQDMLPMPQGHFYKLALPVKLNTTTA